MYNPLFSPLMLIAVLEPVVTTPEWYNSNCECRNREDVV